MTITITIKTDNAAFDDPNELSRILSLLAARSRAGETTLDGLRLFDINGNKVGVVKAA